MVATLRMIINVRAAKSLSVAPLHVQSQRLKPETTINKKHIYIYIYILATLPIGSNKNLGVTRKRKPHNVIRETNARPIKKRVMHKQIYDPVFGLHAVTMNVTPNRVQ